MTSFREVLASLMAAFCLTGTSALTQASVFAQEPQVRSREIVSEDFTRSRPASSSSSGNPAAKTPSRPASQASTAQATGGKTKRRVYHLVRKQPAPVKQQTRPSAASIKAKPSSSSSNATASINIEQIGITIWRLQSSASTDRGAKILVQEDDRTVELTPMRVEVGMPLPLGERVRLSIESPRTGYLYVFDREQYSDGTLGQPLLIFPTLRTRGGDNRVRAGLLVDIPAQDDQPPYFTLKSSHPGYVGELLTIIVTAEPIEGITIGRSPLSLTPKQVQEWEQAWGADVERFEMVGGAGASWTVEEQLASARGGRALTQDEPAPQTIYRVAVRKGDPLLVNVPLLSRTIANEP